jgi:hypothetical protein
MTRAVRKAEFGHTTQEGSRETFGVNRCWIDGYLMMLRNPKLPHRFAYAILAPRPSDTDQKAVSPDTQGISNALCDQPNSNRDEHECRGRWVVRRESKLSM